jgi:hypothetical protein
MSSPLPLARQEAMVRAVLTLPPDWSLSQIAEATGIDRDTAGRIRRGVRYPGVLPHLRRMTLEETRRHCWDCVQWEFGIGPGGSDRWGRCHLGIPEATESQTFARGCGAYSPGEKLPEAHRPPGEEKPSGDATVAESDS